MTDHPILFSGPMVLALLDGRKTQTRRVIEPYRPTPTTKRRHDPRDVVVGQTTINGVLAIPTDLFLPRWRISDRLWVREAWRTWRVLDDTAPRDLQSGGLSQRRSAIWYEATPNEDQKVGPLKHEIGRLRASMHMPRWASRITLKVTDVRVQRLQDISQEDAIAEGCKGFVSRDGEDGESPKEEFRALWDSLNAARGFGWDTNPWVTATSFQVEKINIDEVKA